MRMITADLSIESGSDGPRFLHFCSKNRICVVKILKSKNPEKCLFLGVFLAHLRGFEPLAYRLGVVARLFCGVMHNITKSEKSLYYGVFQGDAFRTVSRNIADFG